MVDERDGYTCILLLLPAVITLHYIEAKKCISKFVKRYSLRIRFFFKSPVVKKPASKEAG